MKVLFVSHVPEHYVKDREPLGIMHLSAALKKAGHEVRLCAPRLSSVRDLMKVFPAQIIAYSITTGYHNFYLKLNEAVKQVNNKLISVFGGPHATFTVDFIEQSPFIDAVCRGEGDYVVVEFVNRLESEGDYHLTPNFYVRRNGEIYRNEVQNLIDDINLLPFPDRELVYDAFPMVAKSGIRLFITTRGCPYHCAYCWNSFYNKIYKGKGNTLRRRSVDNVVSEIMNVATKYPLELVYFRDDTFVQFPTWVEEFSRKYKERINIPFVCTVRLNLITEKMVADLKSANCVSVEAGIEAGNDYIRNEVLHRSMSREQILKGTKILLSYGIKILSENLIGVPNSTLENELETYSLNKKCSVYYMNTQVFQPYRGTKLYEYTKKLGLLKQAVHDITPKAFLRGESILDIENTKQRERFNKIGPICIRLKLSTWVVKLLIFLPLLPIYSLIHVIFKGYCGSKLYPFRMTFRQKVQIFFQVFRQHHIWWK